MRLDPAGRRPLEELDEVDLIVLGSGAGGLSAALTGVLEGMRVALLDHAPVLGGTTARSSGTAWIPDNRLMRAAGFPEDREPAQAYLQALVGTKGSTRPWETFLDLAPRMQADLEDRAGILFRPYLRAPDYRSNLPGAASGGRALEPAAFDGRLLGGWFALLAPPLAELTVLGGMMLTRAEAQRLIRAERSARAMQEGARLLVRHLRDRWHHPRGTRLVMGNALVARMLHAFLMRGGMAWENAHTQRIETAAGRVAGVSGSAEGRAFHLKARRGIVLAGGGFPADPEAGAQQLPPTASGHTVASPFARGKTIRLGLQAGGQLGPSVGTNGFWFPSSLMVRPGGGLAVYPHIALDRAKPGSLIVDRTGRRFANEAASYHDFGEAMHARGRDALPCWMIADAAFIRRYGFGLIRPRTRRLGPYLAAGYLKRGEDVADLALRLGLEPERLRATIKDFNALAGRGKDEDFGRGESAYERSNGDEGRELANPCLAEIGPGPLFALALWPTPLATARGLACGEAGQVLDGSGIAIPGLYAAGNDMQSVFAGEYPGAGAQIGPAMTFGWAAARHAARQEEMAE
ncbi:FAD-dependent oxidoreductase [Paracoccus sp. MBLB3053]|uniref:FAD-dependent oxidoreductase n=1 Tax=Paracoccus aurantius TaxID=3073814 RepID=A0ABU2HZ12_9RHOB|nr:FAD-binding protein [Paracoccus sp. MBLB3053]MDS9469824.1 FAD-dependent oxidoreductase [Paracoccus sp. MBLB3053]